MNDDQSDDDAHCCLSMATLRHMLASAVVTSARTTLKQKRLPPQADLAICVELLIEKYLGSTKEA